MYTYNYKTLLTEMNKLQRYLCLHIRRANTIVMSILLIVTKSHPNIIVFHFKIYCKAIIIKTEWYWYEICWDIYGIRYSDQCNKTQNSEDLGIYCQLFLTMVSKVYIGKGQVLQ